MINSFEKIALEMISVAKGDDAVNKFIPYASYSKAYDSDEQVEIYKITGCELPIIVHYNDSTFNAYSKSKIIRSYLILISYLYSQNIEWHQWFIDHKLTKFLTASRVKGLNQYWEFLSNFDKNQLLQIYKIDYE